MKLTPELKQSIDNMDIESLLRRIRNSPCGDEMFQGESGEYWMERYAKMRNDDPVAAIQASKNIPIKPHLTSPFLLHQP